MTDSVINKSKSSIDSGKGSWAAGGVEVGADAPGAGVALGVGCVVDRDGTA